MAKMLTVEDVSKLLNRKPNTVRMKAHSGEIPYFFKVGRDWRIMEDDFYRWINELKEMSIGEKI